MSISVSGYDHLDTTIETDLENDYDTWTAMGWGKLSTLSRYRAMLVRRVSGRAYFVGTDTSYGTNNWMAYFDTSTGQKSVIGSTNAANEWTHLAAVYDGAYVRLYVNGVEEGTAQALTGNIDNDSTSKIGIGYDYGDTSSGSWVGRLSHLYLSSAALTAEEVSYYHQGKSYIQPRGCKLWMPFWEDSSVTEPEDYGPYDLAVTEANGPTYDQSLEPNIGWHVPQIYMPYDNAGGGGGSTIPPIMYYYYRRSN